MATVNSNDLVLLEASDMISPLHAVINTVTQSVSNRMDASIRIWPVADTAARTALVNQIGTANISADKPLYVSRADAPVTRKLQVTYDGVYWRAIRTDDNIRVIVGSVNIPTSASSTSYQAPITFPTGTFNGAPVVLPSISATFPNMWRTTVSGVSSTGATVNVYKDAAAGSSAVTVSVPWVAIGFGDN